MKNKICPLKEISFLLYSVRPFDIQTGQDVRFKDKLYKVETPFCTESECAFYNVYSQKCNVNNSAQNTLNG